MNTDRIFRVKARLEKYQQLLARRLKGKSVYEVQIDMRIPRLREAINNNKKLLRGRY